MTESGSSGKKGKGFAGLDSMVSDVSEDVGKAAKTAAPKASASEPPPPEPAPQPARPKRRAAPAESSPSGSGQSGLGWVIGGVIVLVIWIANSGSDNKNQPAPSYSPPFSHSSPAPAAAPAPAPAPTAPVSDDQKPPVGRDNVLNIPQIRWCKREKIRIEAIESVINNAYEHEVNRFNAKVADYNSRCAKFRYYRDSVELVERETAPERSSIAAETRSEWAREMSGVQTPTPSALPNPTSRSIGSYGGGAGSFVVPRRQEKIMAKPKHREDAYRDHASSSVDHSSAEHGPRAQPQKPENSHWKYRFARRTDEWRCNVGFKQIGDSCEQLSPPPENAAYMRVDSEKWDCKSGYRQIVSGGSCVIGGEK